MATNDKQDEEEHADHSTTRGLVAAMVDEVECGLLACSPDGGLRYANRSAREELESERVLKLCNGLIRQADGSRNAVLEAALRDASLRGRRRMLSAGTGVNRMLLSIVPLREASIGSCAAPVLVVMGRRGPCSALGIEMLSNVHGLTLAERRVLAALLAGEVPRGIAVRHEVAVSTVRTQIKSIREKVGVTSVEGLFVRAAEVPPVNSALRRYGGSDGGLSLAAA